MSLIAALNIGQAALNAQQRGLEVTGHNVANVNTEGYTRQRLDLVAARPVTISGGLILGLGVDVREIRSTLDSYLNERVRLADSTLEDLGTRSEMLQRIEAIVGELSDTDLSSAFDKFFAAVEDLANHPEDTSTRVTLLQVADGFATQVKTLYSQLARFRDERLGTAQSAADEINRLVADIAQLNTDIAAREADPSPQLANDLRDQRDVLIAELSRLVYVRSYEDQNGMVNLYAGSTALVQGRTYQEVEFTTETTEGVTRPVIRLKVDGRELEVTGGKLLALQEVGEELIGGVIGDLNDLISTFMYEVNRVHSQGQGLVEYTSDISGNSVRDSAAVLSGAGLPFTVKNGSFTFNVVNKQTGEVTSFNIEVDLDGVGSDSTLQSIAAEFAAEVTAASPEITAGITGTGKLEIKSSSTNYGFTYGEDTSGFLAAIGLGSFFTGRNASDIGVSSALVSEPRLVAAARSDSFGDNSNAVAMAALRLAPIEELNGATFSDYYQGVVSSMAASTAHAQDLEQNQSALLTSLLNERERVSGVNIDEEAIRLITYQRAYQAAARYISVINAALDTLLAI